MSTTTNVQQVKLNIMTQAQYNSATKNENELYMLTDAAINYNDLTNKPTIPTVNDATLTIQKNGTDVQTFSANASSNVTANITVPTAISDLTDDTSTTPIDKADTLTGLTASVTELNYVDGVTSAIQTQIDGKADTTLSNVSSIDSNSAVQTALDGKVSKSGDTMSGRLTFDTDANDDYGAIYIQNSNIEQNVLPATNLFERIRFVDKNENYRAAVFYRHGSSGDVSIRLNVFSLDGTNDLTTSMGYDASGNPYFNFPNSKGVDGQFVDTDININNNTNTAVGSYNFSLSSYLPKDGYNYEVYIHAYGSYSASGAGCTVYSDIYTQAATTGSYSQVNVGANGRNCANDFIIPVGTGRKIYYQIVNNAFNSLYLRINGYRRMGTNA